MLDCRHRTRQCGDNAELSGNEACHVKSRLADADHRHGSGTARCIKAGIVETGNDAGIGGRALLHFPDHARNGKNLVEISFDARRTVGGIARDDCRAGTCHAACSLADLVRHRCSCIGVDDKYFHFPRTIEIFVFVLDGPERLSDALPSLQYRRSDFPAQRVS